MVRGELLGRLGKMQTYDVTTTTGAYNDGAPVLITRVEHSGALVADAYVFDVHYVTPGSRGATTWLQSRTYYGGHTPDEVRELFRSYCAQHGWKIVG